MSLSLNRLLSIIGAITAVAFVVAGIVRHAKHGAGLVVGDVAWFTFLTGSILTIALGIAAAVRMLLRRRAIHLAAGAVLALTLAAFAASATSAANPQKQTITATFLTIGRSEKPTHVVATGPISGTGSATQTEKRTATGQVNYATLHFDRGLVRLTANEPRFGFRMNQRTCTGSAYGDGTFTITGGTGAYAGASGKGTFSTSGTVVSQRTTTGKCLGSKGPLGNTVFFVRIAMKGVAAVQG